MRIVTVMEVGTGTGRVRRGSGMGRCSTDVNSLSERWCVMGGSGMCYWCAGVVPLCSCEQRFLAVRELEVQAEGLALALDDESDFEDE